MKRKTLPAAELDFVPLAKSDLLIMIVNDESARRFLCRPDQEREAGIAPQRKGGILGGNQAQSDLAAGIFLGHLHCFAFIQRLAVIKSGRLAELTFINLLLTYSYQP